ncbi:SAM-dependent MidA family methyltransferase [Thermovibrio guaymasensis]|uniref:SAM-dependent MidA family methyltransferase n=1 Tax=Thermovibrio guaymasensis TaxID=240167 RepID=A0A420W7J5_9BACT|nr:SAM-dependent methyltransferase [Thermovibrio guaymasensis]RKQ63291.1 SAM-dependent MidA family methyltransferase [Thermovibrio guaymasensis]
MGSPLEFILSEVKEKGGIPFDRFVEICLYHKEFGYYTSKRLSNLPGEDFFTAPELSPLFGKVVAEFLKRKVEEFSLPPVIVEIGGGKGFLAKDLIGEIEPEEYFFVERREPPIWLKGKVKWFSEVSQLPEFEGVVVSNELFDSFPFKRVIKKEGELFEIFILEKGGSLVEEYRPFRGSLPCEPKENCEYPLFIGWEEFLKDISGKLKRGLFLTFDYGGECREISSKRSFRAYKDGKLWEDYLSEPGSVDLTADVDFTRLKELLKREGFEEMLYQPQSSFLLENGIEKFATPSQIPQILTLLVEMGRRFKVLGCFKP